MDTNKIIQGDCLEKLKEIPDRSVNCCVTSPPYFGLRDYGTATWEGGDPDCNHFRDNHVSDSCTTGHTNSQKKGGIGSSIYKTVCKKCGAIRKDSQVGLEETPEKFVEKMVDIFREVKRVLKDDGTLWLNLGDSYAGSGKAGNDPEYQKKHTQFGQIERKERLGKVVSAKSIGLKGKDLIGIPWMVVFALRDDGWYLRQDIIWHKPNPMPESVTDRCTKSHEYIFLLSKNQKYYFDNNAIKTEMKNVPISRAMRGVSEDNKYINGAPGSTAHSISKPRPNVPKSERKSFTDNMAGGGSGLKDHSGYYDKNGNIIGDGMANKKSVWTVPTKSYRGAHFATYPENLIVDCIKAGCPEGGIVLDPFMGAGTTGLVARKLNRNFIGIELNPEYIDIANKRLYNELGMFL